MEQGDEMTTRWGLLARRRLRLAALLLMAVGGAAIAQHTAIHAGAHQHFDGRFSHNRYYFDHGYSVHRPPGEHREFRGADGGRYWFHDGNWYRSRNRDWVIVGAPIGVFVPTLPPYFTTVWWNGSPYYYANDTYYVWNDSQQQYQVVAPPEAMDAAGTTRAPASDQLYVYPNKGQSPEQQENDRYECHRLAVQQSGFDPTKAGGGVAPEVAVVKRNDYFNSQVACLESRGYSVR
jgi:hypothetical protein